MLCARSDYVQVLGLTYYEFGNGDLVSFPDLYKELYAMNEPYFRDWPMIVGEFACGAIGDSQGLASEETRKIVSNG